MGPICPKFTQLPNDREVYHSCLLGAKAKQERWSCLDANRSSGNGIPCSISCAALPSPCTLLRGRYLTCYTMIHKIIISNEWVGDLTSVFKPPAMCGLQGLNHTEVAPNLPAASKKLQEEEWPTGEEKRKLIKPETRMR